MVWELGSKKGYIKDHQQRPFFARIEYKMAKFYSCLFPFSAHLSSFQRRIWSIITKKSTFCTSFESSIKNWLKHFNQSVDTGWGTRTVTPTKLFKRRKTVPHPILVLGKIKDWSQISGFFKSCATYIDHCDQTYFLVVLFIRLIL